MRRVLTVLIAGLLCSLADAAAAQLPTGDSVTGTGTFADGSAFSFDAHSGPSGESPAGTATLGFFQPGPVSCLHVEGNIALILVNTPTFQFPVTIKVTDGTPDRVDSAPAGGEPCGGGVSRLVQFVVTGDIVVTDAQPLPRSKDQCKDGGWRNFAGFKNQGDCVSFVATKGKSQPAGH